MDLWGTTFIIYIVLTNFVNVETVCEKSSTVINVVDYGATGDGQNDDSQAFLKAWKDLCEAEVSYYGLPTMEIPGGKTFKLLPVHFQGPCKSKFVRVEVSGTIIGPAYKSGWKNCYANSWLGFSNVANLIINGSGIFDGRGEIWWNNQDKNHHHETSSDDQPLPFLGYTNCYRPTALFIYNCSNFELRGLTHVNSPRNHINIIRSNNVTLSNLNITAPESSPNTDGIDIGFTTYVRIQNSTIATGDDCIAIKGNCSHINISGIVCGPGHGISVGSLGANEAYETVEEVIVRNSTFKGSMYGARIKTWQGGSGYARNIHFEGIGLENASNPIIIDQFYCDGGHSCKNMTKAVSVSNVTYTGVKGTSAWNCAITLNCAKINCTNIKMDYVNITSAAYGGEIFASCMNTKGTSAYTTPTVPCLQDLGHGTPPYRS